MMMNNFREKLYKTVVILFNEEFKEEDKERMGKEIDKMFVDKSLIVKVSLGQDIYSILPIFKN